MPRGEKKRLGEIRAAKEEILAIITAIELACTLLKALIPVLKTLLGTFDAAAEIIRKSD